MISDNFANETPEWSSCFLAALASGASETEAADRATRACKLLDDRAKARTVADRDERAALVASIYKQQVYCDTNEPPKTYYVREVVGTTVYFTDESVRALRVTPMLAPIPDETTPPRAILRIAVAYGRLALPCVPADHAAVARAAVEAAELVLATWSDETACAAARVAAMDAAHAVQYVQDRRGLSKRARACLSVARAAAASGRVHAVQWTTHAYHCLLTGVLGSEGDHYGSELYADIVEAYHEALAAEGAAHA